MNKKPLILLVDTTVLYSGLVYKGQENKVLGSSNYIFITSQFTTNEIYRLLRSKRNMTHEDSIKTIHSLPVIIVNFSFSKDKLEEADKLIGFRDKSDIPLVALALALEDIHDGIWSSDRDFEVLKSRFKIWKTRELLQI